MGVTTVLWVVCGYSMAFSGRYGDPLDPDIGGIIGNFHMAFLHGVTATTPFPGSPTIPLVVFIAYQMMFAQITPALITGAFANRVTFKAYLLFLSAWLLLVYFPVAHMVWGGGLLQQHGVLDFAGGIVVHATAGFAALAAVFYVGRRKVPDQGLHSIPLVALGTGLLWFGWYGFNAGSELKVDPVTSMAFLNTDIAASFAAMTWLVLAWTIERKPKFVGLLTGSIAGLAAVTPAAGYVSTGTAVLIGIVSSVICYYAIWLKNRMQWDDALDVWGVHGVGGVTGVFALAIFATKVVNPDGGADGLLHGGTAFFAKEIGAVVGAAAYAFAFTYVMLIVIDRITAVKVTAAEEETGLDQTLHGEQAYI
jgi:Amt family ammonium transporter